MSNIWLLNAASFNMLSPEHMLGGESGFKAQPLSLEEAKALLADGFTSAVGHADTAAVYSAQLGMDVPANRTTVALKSDEVVVVGQYVGPRLQEGATTLPDGAQIIWLRVTVL